MPVTTTAVLSRCDVSSPLILTVVSRGDCCYYPHLTGKETKGQKAPRLCPHPSWAQGPSLKPKLA